MTTEILIPLGQLIPNPYQPRKAQDIGAVIELAMNIKSNATDDFDGLLQAPTVRKTAAGYELAFGHTRTQAFKYLYEVMGLERYSAIRAQVRDLSDLQMFEMAVAENIKRRDLNPIEQAEAIQTYMETFGKSSAEAAEFFGMAASTVRGTVRLLNLPPAAQEKVRSGEIRTGEARALLTVEKLMGAEGVERVLERMAEDLEGPLEAIQHTLRWDAKAELLNLEDEWVKANPFPTKHLKSLTPKDIKACLSVEDTETYDLESLVSVAQSGMAIQDEFFGNFDPEDLERVRILQNPPACESCPLHAQLDGEHYCPFKLCASRKEEAWWLTEAERIADEAGVQLYDKERDGAFEKLNPYNDATKKMWKEGHADLRLMASNSQVYGNNNIDELLNHHVNLVAVGKTMEKLRKKDEKKTSAVATTESGIDYKLEQQLREAAFDICTRFQWEVAAKTLAGMFDGITSFDLLEDLDREFGADYPDGVIEYDLIAAAKKAKKADGLAQMRRVVAMGMIGRHLGWSSNEKKPVVKYARDISARAEKWGVKMPKDWTAQAEKYQAELETTLKEIREARKKEKGQ